jgi:hypothetical protein
LDAPCALTGWWHPQFAAAMVHSSSFAQARSAKARVRALSMPAHVDGTLPRYGSAGGGT